MADFDYVPINTTAEKIEKISNMDVLTGKVETENDNTIVTATALLKTLDEDKIPIITSLLLKPLLSNEVLRYKAGSNIHYIQYISELVDGEEVTTINNHYNILKGSVITLTYKATSFRNGFSCFLTVKLDTPWIVGGYPKEGQFIYKVSVLNDNLEIIDISFKEVDPTKYATKDELAEAIGEALEGDY